MRGAVPLLPPLYLHGVNKNTSTLTIFTIPTKSSDSSQLNNKVEGTSFENILNPGRVAAHVSQCRCVLYKWERRLKMGVSSDCSRVSLFPTLNARQR